MAKIITFKKVKDTLLTKLGYDENKQREINDKIEIAKLSAINKLDEARDFYIPMLPAFGSMALLVGYGVVYGSFVGDIFPQLDIESMWPAVKSVVAGGVILSVSHFVGQYVLEKFGFLDKTHRKKNNARRARVKKIIALEKDIEKRTGDSDYRYEKASKRYIKEAYNSPKLSTELPSHNPDVLDEKVLTAKYGKEEMPEELSVEQPTMVENNAQENRPEEVEEFVFDEAPVSMITRRDDKTQDK